MLCRSGNIGRDDVGAIRVQESETFVEVLASRAPAMMAAVGAGGRLEGDVTIRALPEAPFVGSSTDRVEQAPGPRVSAPHRKPAYMKKKSVGQADTGLAEHGLREAEPTKEPARKPFNKADGKKHRKGAASAGPTGTKPPKKSKAKPGKSTHRKGGMTAPKRPKA